jgi:hypothetical protein
MSAALFLALFAALFAAILRLARRDPALTQPERLVASATLALALLTALLLALGFLGLLRVPWVLGGMGGDCGGGMVRGGSAVGGRRSAVLKPHQRPTTTDQRPLHRRPPTVDRPLLSPPSSAP